MATLLETLQQLGGCAGGVAAYHTTKRLCQTRNAALPSRELRRFSVATLRGLFPAVDFDIVRYKTQAELPANWIKSSTDGRTVAMTFGNTIYFNGRLTQRDPENFVNLIHEVVHVDQYQRWGEQEFACRYGEGVLSGGGTPPAYIENPGRYENNPLEAEAFNFEAQFRDENTGEVIPGRIPWLETEPVPVDDIVPFVHGIMTALPSGVYFSPDGHNLGGGGNTVRVYGGQARVDKMIPFQNGVITAFYNPSNDRPWGIYYSPDGRNLGGGGNTIRVYDGDARVNAMIPFNNGVITAFYNPSSRKSWGIYYSRDGRNLGGGGNTIRAYEGKALVNKMIPFNHGVITAFYNFNSGNSWGIYFSPDGQNLGGGGNSVRVYEGKALADAIIPFNNGIVTAFYKASSTRSWGIYFSRDGDNLGGGGNTLRAYTGDARVESMVPFANSVVTAFYSPKSFRSWGMYRSPDGLSLGGGGNTHRTYRGGQRIPKLAVFGNQILIGTKTGGVFLTNDPLTLDDFSQYTATRVYP